ncbi:hypothetical protein [Desulfovibrio sp. UCD-KL4C]|uniref:hypothetical protein n=1 Tax=Desulfovibrio sp. UCD-KL4C TaxID=2578120 RepID=UPI0025BE4F60|nr:hypothetical protein [Desulfovibrio sp. UCD-KL4C]
MEKKKLPPLSPKAPGRPDKPRYKEQFGVIVICGSETEHEEVYKKLTGMGYKCKAVRT